MRKTVLTALIAMSICTVKAQEKKNLVKLSVGILNKVRIGYERPIDNNFSYGGVINAYYGLYPGFKIEPFGRYYFGSESPEGLYSQLRVLYGNFNYTYASSLISESKSFSSTGGGLDLGYQWISGKNKNIVVDASLGFQFMSKSSDVNAVDAIFYTTGPGAVFNPHLSIGYAF